MAPYAHITGWGKAIPERELTNDELGEMIDTNDEWIRSRTGIRARRIASEEQTTASLGADAAIKALQVANLSPADLDLIICSTSTPEYIFPATACIIQDTIGAVNAGAFDLLAACTGFIFALNMAAQSIRSGSLKNVLVIGSETLSRFVDWNDRAICILFGDGAGAFVLQASEEPGGVLSATMRSDGSGGDVLSIPGGGSVHPTSAETIRDGLHYIQMNGREVFRFATRVMAQATHQAIAKAGLTLDDIEVIIPHQANKRIIEAAARGLKLPIERFVINVDRYGNTSTASIPIATVEAIEEGRLEEGDNIVFVGFGGGLTWGSMAVKWTGSLPTETRIHPARVRTLARLRSWLLRLARRIEGLIWGRRGYRRRKK